MSVHDSIKELSATTGTGSLTLAGAISGYETFAANFAVNERFYYGIVNVTDPTEWETGEGYLSTSSILERAKVFESSNSNALVNFTGTQHAYCTLPSAVINSQLGLSTQFSHGLAGYM